MIFLVTSSNHSLSSIIYFLPEGISSFTKNIVDSIGSGDALLSYATLILFKTKSLIKASIIGSIAAACECEIDGNKPITPSKVKTKINEIEKMFNYIHSLNNLEIFFNKRYFLIYCAMKGDVL